jgi:hypothetical protein
MRRDQDELTLWPSNAPCDVNGICGSGRTTRQMQAAPKNAIYIWYNSQLDYPKRVAATVGRADLQIVRPGWLSAQRWRGHKLTGVVVDHACELDAMQRDALMGALARVR